MKHVLFISENFWISDSADKNCTLHLIDGLSNAGYQIDVFSHTYMNNSEDENNKNYSLHYFFEKEQLFIDNYLCKNRNLLERIISKILVFLVNKIGIYCQKRMQYKKFLELNKNNKIDYIISVYCPVFSNEIAYYIYKKTKKKTFLYFLDPHTYNYQYKNFVFKSNFKTRSEDEKRWAKCAKGIIYSKGIVEENLRNNFNPYGNLPFIDITLPNFKIERNRFENIDKEKTVLIYTGKFYENIRNPDALISILGILDKNKYVVEFYGECCEYLNKHYEKLPECIRLMGIVGSEKCKEVLDSADILINVGNTTPNQVPSKVFEYISTGKPILNIINSENDISLYYLNMYPKVYNFKSGEAVDLNLLQDFLSDTSQISVESLNEIYKDFLIDNIVTKITNFIESCG